MFNVVNLEDNHVKHCKTRFKSTLLKLSVPSIEPFVASLSHKLRPPQKMFYIALSPIPDSSASWQGPCARLGRRASPQGKKE